MRIVDHQDGRGAVEDDLQDPSGFVAGAVRGDDCQGALTVLSRQLEPDCERALAKRYFAHSAPRATPLLWRQVILILDGLNAAVFDSASRRHSGSILWHSLTGALTRRSEWKSFLSGLDSQLSCG